MRSQSKQSGFSIVELAIVLLVLGVLMRSAVQPLAARMATEKINESQMQLKEIKRAITGYLILHGRLPCPGSESIVGGSACTAIEGGLSASILGLSGETDNDGFILDPWGGALRYRLASRRPLHLRFFSSSDSGNSQSTSIATQTTLADASDEQPLLVCRSAATRRCSKQNIKADQLGFVILSHGRDSSTAGAQAANQDDNGLFVQLADSAVPEHRFDDQLAWMAKNEIAYWLVRSGRWGF